MPSPIPRKEISISSEAFDEMTGALQDAGIKLEKDDEFTVKRDMAIKGPILYRQVNLRHQILTEVVKVYEPLPDDNGMCKTDSSHFINFLDDVYKYCLTGDKPEATTTTQPKASGWGTTTRKN